MRVRPTRLVSLSLLLACGLAAVFVTAGDTSAAPDFDAASAPPVVVIGIDGASAREVEAGMDAGRLPNLARLRDQGGYSPLATTNPAQSPVSWAAMTTGRNPGVTGIYDFLRRRFTRTGDVTIDIGLAEKVERPTLGGPWGRAGVVALAGLIGIFVGLLAMLMLRRMGLLTGKHARHAVLTAPGAVLAVVALVALRDVPESVTHARNLRGGEPFWVTLDKAGVRTCVLEAPLGFPADDMHVGCCLTGLGTPDAQGTWGTFTMWTDDRNSAPKTETGGVAYYVPRTEPRPALHTFDVVLKGPRDPLLGVARESAIRKRARLENAERSLRSDWTPRERRLSRTREQSILDELRVRATFRCETDGTTATLITPSGERVPLPNGAWTEPVPFELELSRLAAVTERARLPVQASFLMERDDDGGFLLLATPTQFDPGKPLPPNVAVSSPPEYAQEVAGRVGTFDTLGWPELTNPVKDDVLSDRMFLAHVKRLTATREKRLMDALAQTAGPDRRFDCVFAMFGECDRVQHALWRHRDPESPRHDPEAAAELGGAIDEIYAEVDRIVGRVLDEAPEGTTVLVVSDHGFAPFRRGVNLNNFLRSQGFQVPRAGAGAGTKRVGDLVDGAFFEDYDWERTRAYAMGLGNVYLNLEGREPGGIVTPEEAPALLDRIRTALLALRDEDGTKVVREVYYGRDLYRGARTGDAPDLVVGFEWGYRVSWQTCLGNVDRDVIIPNTQRWSGDHCSVDPSLVPGVVFANRPLVRREGGGAPDVLDVAPTIVTQFGTTVPEHEGEPLLPARGP